MDLFCSLTSPIHASVSCAPTHMSSDRKCRKLKRRVECEYKSLTAKLTSSKYHVGSKYVTANVHYISHSTKYSFINAIHKNFMLWLKAIVTNAPWINIKEQSNEKVVKWLNWSQTNDIMRYSLLTKVWSYLNQCNIKQDYTTFCCIITYLSYAPYQLLANK